MIDGQNNVCSGVDTGFSKGGGCGPEKWVKKTIRA